jgi:GxxExxY protein
VLRNHIGVALEVEAVVEKVLGCAFTVHRAMCLELEAQGLPFEREKPLVVMYRGQGIPGQRVDLLVGGVVIVEVKAVAALEPVHLAQVLSYLKTTRLRIGLLINFREVLLRNGIRRVVL